MKVAQWCHVQRINIWFSSNYTETFSTIDQSESGVSDCRVIIMLNDLLLMQLNRDYSEMMFSKRQHCNTCLYFPCSYFVDASSRACRECDHTCEECSESSSFCLRCREGYFLLRKPGQCLRTCPSNYFPHTLLDRECQRCHPTCKTCKGKTCK